MIFKVINYENNGWIFEKIKKIVEKSFKKIFNEKIQNKFNEIIFHIHFDLIEEIDESKLNIFFVTHVDSLRKKLKIINLSKKKNTIFFTMSNDTKKLLSTIIHSKYIYSNNFFENLKIPNKPKNIFGFFFRNYADGRKNKELLHNIINLISKSNNSKLIIFGEGFDNYNKFNNVKIIKKKFDNKLYRMLLKKCDYVIATGRDEGYVSILDATNLGIKIIAINQGYHSEFALVKGSLLANNEEILLNILQSIINCNNQNILNSVTNNLRTAIKKINKNFISFKGNFTLNLYFLFKFNKFSNQSISLQIIYLLKNFLKK